MTFNREDAVAKLIDLGCDAAEVDAGFLQKHALEAARTTLKQSIPTVETTLEAWLIWMQATYGVRLVDSQDKPVHFQ